VSGEITAIATAALAFLAILLREVVPSDQPPFPTGGLVSATTVQGYPEPGARRDASVPWSSLTHGLNKGRLVCAIDP
jgi:hypothetical protein